ncbi:hypothetical protein [Amycolatopsis ruanii]|uniref:hypothetical protein n=1 Tax=Amycolatopsis ruanii TaxID=944491 RepID=UPI000E24F00C|nr:hypothetical protein [Amycolatopsis ruanii]
MTLLFRGELHVHYGQFSVESRTDGFFDGLTDARGGQSNGLCGAAVPGLLFLTTGLHTGNVEVTVEVLDAPPPVGPDWEDVVEVSFRPATATVRLVQWTAEASWPLDLAPVSYRVRYCASGMDRARERDTRLDGEPLLDRYLLQLWPAPPAADAVVRQTSAIAAYWHDHARTLPPPPTPEQREAARRQERLARERALREAARAAEVRRWGGRPPGERLRRVNGGLVLAALDRDLTEAIEQLDETTQRAVAVWVARRACAEAGLDGLDWVAPALAALGEGTAVPPPFDDHVALFDRIGGDARVVYTTVSSYDGRHARVSQQHAALPAVCSAAAADPLAAAAETLFHATVTVGGGYPRLFAALRQAFPALSR